MNFNIKNLLLPISIITSISGSCVNATEPNINPNNNMEGQNINVNDNLVNANANMNNNIDAIDAMITNYRNKYNNIHRIRNRFVKQKVLSHLSEKERMKIQICGAIHNQNLLRQIFLLVNE